MRETTERRPRLGFLGVGWIGRHRMQAILDSGLATVAAIADLPAAAQAAAALTPDATVVASLAELLALDLDGVVIATPSALHAEQTIAVLAAGLPVFCQKPLGRNAGEAAQVVEAARTANLLLGVDLSYRYTSGMQQVRDLIAAGEIGTVYAADLLFHNAYGPDKPWFYDRQLAGGGCVIDLGVHLVDLALWCLGFPALSAVSSRLFAGGKPLLDDRAVEDYALARLDLASGAAVQLACSWKLSVGSDAMISVTFYGTGGGLSFHNLDGSFYHFAAERFRGTSRELLTNVEEQWGGRAAVAWAGRLAAGDRFDPTNVELVAVAEALDRIYAGH